MLSALTQQTDLLLHYDDWRARYVALRGLASVIQASEVGHTCCSGCSAKADDGSRYTMNATDYIRKSPHTFALGSRLMSLQHCKGLF